MDRGTVRNMKSSIPKINLRNWYTSLVLLQEFFMKHSTLWSLFVLLLVGLESNRLA